jgi:hypothetical protein
MPMGTVKRPHTSKHSPARVRAAERQRNAMELRKAGATYAAIAGELGYSDARSAERAVIAGLRAAGREASEDLLPMELDRLDRLQAGLWADAINGEVPAVLACLRIMERRSRLVGLDAPLKMNQRIDSHEQVNIDVTGAVMVIRADGQGGAYMAAIDGPKDDYIAGLRAMRGDVPLAVEGSSRVQDGPPIDMAEPGTTKPPDDDHGA